MGTSPWYDPPPLSKVTLVAVAKYGGSGCFKMMDRLVLSRLNTTALTYIVIGMAEYVIIVVYLLQYHIDNCAHLHF